MKKTMMALLLSGLFVAPTGLVLAQTPVAPGAETATGAASRNGDKHWSPGSSGNSNSGGASANKGSAGSTGATGSGRANPSDPSNTTGSTSSGSGNTGTSSPSPSGAR